MFKDAIWNSSVNKAFEDQGERQKYSDKIMELVNQRLSKFNQIILALKPSKQKSFLFGCIDISNLSHIVEAKYEKDECLKHFLALSFLLSSLINLPNSLEKLVVFWKMLIDYQEFQSKSKDHKVKFLISEMSRISVGQPASSIKIAIVDGVQTEGNLITNINNLLGINSLIQKLEGKQIQINNGKKYSFQEKRVFTPFLNDFGKIFAVPAKLSYSLIVTSMCEMLTFIYTMFSEEIFQSKEAYEVIEQIDGIVHSGVLKYIFEDLQTIAIEGARREFGMLDTCLEVNLNDDDRRRPKLDDFL